MVDVLIAFDTDHIKKYVFGTDTLKEIRGASSLLDRLNRVEMENVAKEKQIDVFPIYTNGGSGLFLVEKGQEDTFGKAVQAKYRELTGGGSSITYIVQELPPDAPQDRDELLKFPMQKTLKLMRYKLRAQKDIPQEYIALPSHPFMRPCSECGIEYAGNIELGAYEQDVSLIETEEIEQGLDEDELNEQVEFLCMSCRNKLIEDEKVKKRIQPSIRHYRGNLVGKSPVHEESPLWDALIKNLHRHLNYRLPFDTKRPQDFNVFRAFKGAKDYIALIYADGNNMGKTIEGFRTLNEIQAFAERVDSAVMMATSSAIAEHLQVGRLTKPGVELPRGEGEPLFPFDILLLGGDDLVMVTPASVALDVALTITNEFHKLTKDSDPKKKGYTLSVGVVLAPMKYPFGMLLELAETTLKFAKKKAAKRQLDATGVDQGETGMINFMTVLGSAGRNFSKFYGVLKSTKEEKDRTGQDFYATLRPYDTEQFSLLLEDIRKGRKKNLGRTKLHQLRGAILEKNLTTSISDVRAGLRNWNKEQSNFVVDHLYAFAARYQQQQSKEDDPSSLFYRVTFPWFADGKDANIYRTSLLDFVELYDFVMVEEGDSGDED
ncbi:MAG TPA: hypothetical protein VNG51_22280 [Ktedonobacteraceae bacterium]|nr:hypothetical protein [Ktedonobacteraceae bacterium]